MSAIVLPSYCCVNPFLGQGHLIRSSCNLVIAKAVAYLGLCMKAPLALFMSMASAIPFCRHSQSWQFVPATSIVRNKTQYLLSEIAGQVTDQSHYFYLLQLDCVAWICLMHWMTRVLGFGAHVTLKQGVWVLWMHLNFCCFSFLEPFVPSNWTASRGQLWCASVL